MSYKAAIFDLDGTLLDTLADLADAMNSALENEGLPIHPVDAYRYFVGDGVDVLVRRSAPKELTDKAVYERLIAGQRAAYSKNWSRLTFPYSGIPDLLDTLKERKIKLAVLSNKPHDFTVEMVQHYFGKKTFAVVQGVKKGGVKKPDPAGALEIAETLRCQTSEFLYLGDTNTDMETANSAGMFAVGVAWGFRPVEELIKAGARSIISQPDEMLRLL